MTDIKKLETERDELAAHVEELHEALTLLESTCGEGWLDIENPIRVYARTTLAKTPATSLARRDAQKQAEALEGAGNNLPESYAKRLWRKAAELRRQADAE